MNKKVQKACTAVTLACIIAGASAAADCTSSKPIDFADGSSACLEIFSTLDATTKQTVFKDGKATVRTVKSKVGHVVLRMLEEKNSKAASRRAIGRRARGICSSLKNQVLKKVGKPFDPFLVVTFEWGGQPQKSAQTNTRRKLFLNESCRVTDEQ